MGGLFVWAAIAALLRPSTAVAAQRHKSCLPIMKGRAIHLAYYDDPATGNNFPKFLGGQDNIQFDGRQGRPAGFDTDSAEACEEVCRANDLCESWSYGGEGASANKCYLMDKAVTLRYGPGKTNALFATGMCHTYGVPEEKDYTGWQTCASTYCKREMQGGKMQTRVYSRHTQHVEMHTKSAVMDRDANYRMQSKGNDNDKYHGEHWHCFKDEASPDQCKCICSPLNQCYSLEHVAEDGTSTFIKHCAGTADAAEAAATRAAELDCPSGKYFDDPQCKFCPYGKFSDANDDGTAECSLCSPGQYTGVGTSACTVCETGRFSDLGAGACTPITHCELNVNYETFPETLSSDKICTPLTECEEGQYESKQPTLTSDRRCATDREECPEHQWESAPMTATTPKECSDYTRCDNSYLYEIADKTPTSDHQCTYLTICNGDEYQYVRQTYTTDRMCKKQRKCDKDNQYESSAPTQNMDRQCAVVSLCSGRYYEYSKPTAATDRVCRLKTTCWPEYWQMAPATETSDTVCAVLTTCKPDEFELAPPTPSSDRQCAHKSCFPPVLNKAIHKTLAFEDFLADSMAECATKCAKSSECQSWSYGYMHGDDHKKCFLMDQGITDHYAPGETDTKMASGICQATVTTPEPVPLNGIAHVHGDVV